VQARDRGGDGVRERNGLDVGGRGFGRPRTREPGVDQLALHPRRRLGDEHDGFTRWRRPRGVVGGVGRAPSRRRRLAHRTTVAFLFVTYDGLESPDEMTGVDYLLYR